MVQIFFILSLVFVSGAHAVTALDDDFFGPSGPNNTNGGLQTLDPDFFRNSRGQLEKSPAGQFGCTSVWMKTPAGESSAIGSAVQSFCATSPQIKWVPNLKAWRGVPSSYNDMNQVAGYYQICCVRKTEPRRRPRVVR